MEDECIIVQFGLISKNCVILIVIFCVLGVD